MAGTRELIAAEVLNVLWIYALWLCRVKDGNSGRGLQGLIPKTRSKGTRKRAGVEECA